MWDKLAFSLFFGVLASVIKNPVKALKLKTTLLEARNRVTEVCAYLYPGE